MEKFLKEWKSVSDDTVAIASSIGNEILKNAENVETKISSEHTLEFKEGSFFYDVNGLLGKIDKLEIYYTIYYCEDEKDYNYLHNSGALICDANYEEEYIDITAAYINGILQNDYIDNIHHEINHLLQYGNDFTKSNRSSNLYETAVKIAQNKTLPIGYKIPSLLIYYTFRHEVDSFAVQFYSMIKRTFNRANEIDTPEGFSKCLNMFQPYLNLKTSLRMYNERINKPDVKNGILALKIKPETFEHRIDKGVTRFTNKMRHVFQRCCIELRRGHSNEWIFRRIPMLYEKYGHIREGFERAYVINE